MRRPGSAFAWLLYVYIVLQLANNSSGARILAYFAVPAKSHLFVIQPLLDELGKRGHQIVYYTALDGVKFHRNVTVVKLDGHTDFSSDNDDSLFTENSQIACTKNFWSYELALIPGVLQSRSVQDLLKSNEKFDLVLHESFMASEYAATLAHKFQAPSVVLMGLGDSAWVNELSGLPDNPSYMVDWRGQLTDRMSFFERLVNAWNLVASTVLNHYYLYQMESLAHEYVRYPGWESRPHLKDLIADNALILSNSHHSVGYNFPKAPHVKEIGGIHLVPPDPLPKNVAKFMDDATDGVIYFSMGSITDTRHKLIINLRNHLLSALGQLKIKALCKLHDDPSTKVPENVLILPWFPQKDVLAHKNVKLFISHGGLQSTFEAVNYGVPVLAIPFFADQHKNAKIIANSGFGIHLDLYTITNTSLLSAINTILNEPRYKSEAVKRSTLLKDRPISPLNEAVYWIEYVLRHGNVLQPAAVHLSFIQLHQIDTYMFVAFVLIIFIVIVKKLVALIRNYLFEKEHLQRKTSKKVQ